MQSENQQTNNNALFAYFILVFSFRINNNASTHDNACTATNTHQVKNSTNRSNVFGRYMYIEWKTFVPKDKEFYIMYRHIYCVIPDFEFQAKLQQAKVEPFDIVYYLSCSNVPLRIFCVPDWRQCTPNYVTDLLHSFSIHILPIS